STGVSSSSSSSTSKSTSSVSVTTVLLLSGPEEQEADHTEQHGPDDAQQPHEGVRRVGGFVEDGGAHQVEVHRDRLVLHDPTPAELAQVAIHREDHPRGVHEYPHHVRQQRSEEHTSEL